MTLKILHDGFFRKHTTQLPHWTSSESSMQSNRILFQTYINKVPGSFITRLDVRIHASEVTIIIQPAHHGIRTVLLDTLDAAGFEIRPNLLANHLAIRVPFHTRQSEIVRLLNNQEALIHEIAVHLLRTPLPSVFTQQAQAPATHPRR